MARVPTYDNFQASQSTAPDANLTLPSGPNAQQIAGGQLQAAGDAAQRTGDAVSRIALAMQDQINQTRVNDAVNKARMAAQSLAYDPQQGYLNLKGDAALTRPTGQDLTTEYGDKLREQMSQIAGTLGNEQQRRQFQMNAGDLQAQFHGQVENHMLGEFRGHALSVQDGTIALAVNDAKLNWNNPDLIAPSLNAAKAAVYQKGQVSGWSGAQTGAALLTTTSKVHNDVVMAALENNNPQYALKYLDTRKGEMTADDILRVQGHVNQNVWAGMSQQAVSAASAGAATAIAPNNFDRMTQITAQTESGGRETNADGSTVTSPKGALGLMQVMPATMRNPGMGMKGIDPDTATPGQRAQFGRDYLQTLVQRYGDPAKAWAAYNGGYGALDKAMQTAGPNWLAAMPKETQGYVAKNLAALGSPEGGRSARPTEMEFVNAALGALPPSAAPQLVSMTRQHAVQQFGIITKSFAQQGDNALSAAQNWLFQNKDKGVGVNDVPPALIDPLMRYAPGDMRSLEAFSKAIQKGDTVTDLSRYNDIVGNMDQYAKMSDPAWNMLQAKLSPGTFQSLSKERARYISGADDESTGALNRAQINRTLNERLAGLRIPTSVKPDDTSGNERLGGIRQFVDRSIFDAQRASGSKFTPEQIATHIDGLFTKDVQFRNSLWGGSSAQNLMSMQIGDLPSGAADKLKSALLSSGNRSPTNNDILNLYRKLHATAN